MNNRKIESRANIQNGNWEFIRKIINDKKLRIAVTAASHFWFFHTYLGHYVKYATADFQKEMFAITENDEIKKAVIVAFRGSAKSTIMTLSYPLWAVSGKQQKKFVLIISQTQQQAKLHLTNLKRELEGNQMLKQEIGPFEEKEGEWGSTSIVIPKFNARISVASVEQSIRGLRHGANRPDLVICDDVEDLTSVKTREGRNKTYNWFTGEVLPIGDKNTKLVIIGNLLHEDSLLMRLKKDIEDERLSGQYKSYPLIDEKDNIIWPGKFRNLEDIKELKQTIGNENAWQREILLRIIPQDGQVIFPEWMQFYDELPKQKPNYIVVGVDLAISQKETADYTAIVTAYVYGRGKNLKVYISPNPINERLTFPQTLEKIKFVKRNLEKISSVYVCVENVGFQDSVCQQLMADGVRVEGVNVCGQDKRARLISTADYIFSGKVLFPKQGIDNLKSQMVGFGVEKHDDLSDAFSIVITKIIDKNKLGDSVGVIITRA